MKSLVIAEKPSVGRDIAKVLQCGQKKNGAMEGSKYIVTWGLGHLVTLADPEGYGEKYKEWRMEDLPMLPEQIRLEVIQQTGKQYQAVKSCIHNKEVGEIIIATDAGREGELVARLILMKAGNQKPVKRLWISSVTEKAIREGFAHLKPGREYDNLYRAALSRAEADWFVGINATRALTCKYNASLSCGRVQTPTLAMIAKRDEQRRKFVPKTYFGLQAEAENICFTWHMGDAKGNVSVFEQDKVTRLAENLKGEPLVIRHVNKLKKKTYSPALYDLTELQRDANRKFGFSAKDTLNIMQRLYENYKVLTYPRTDSRYLTEDIVDTLKERLQACGTGPYKKLAARLIREKIQAKPSFVNASKVGDHHAIIPTEQFVQLEKMSNEERKIYDLVVKRFLAVLYPPFEYEQTSIEAVIGKEVFTAGGKRVQNAGWQEVYNNSYEEAEEESSEEGSREYRNDLLPALERGDRFTVKTLCQTKGQTKPPAPFNEATLLSAMENPVKFMETKDQKAIQMIGETGGLGTVATRADIIEKLFQSFLIEKQGNDLFITSKAKQLLELVPEELKKPELTANWEMKLSQIAKGKLKEQEFIKEIKNYTIQIVREIRTSESSFRHDNLTNKKCPECGKRMLEVKGKNSKMLVCQDRECGYRETLSRTTNARCPVCHKKMEMTGKGDSSIFICKCGHKEKLKQFEERRKKEGGGVSKKDVAHYLQSQKKQENEPVNNAFADALRKLNIDI